MSPTKIFVRIDSDRPASTPIQEVADAASARVFSLKVGELVELEGTDSVNAQYVNPFAHRQSGGDLPTLVIPVFDPVKPKRVSVPWTVAGADHLRLTGDLHAWAANEASRVIGAVVDEATLRVVNWPQETFSTRCGTVVSGELVYEIRKPLPNGQHEVVAHAENLADAVESAKDLLRSGPFCREPKFVIEPVRRSGEASMTVSREPIPETFEARIDVRLLVPTAKAEQFGWMVVFPDHDDF